MRALRPASVLLAAAGAVLAVALLVAAEPADVVALLRRASPPGLLLAFAWASAVVVARGARLRLVTGPRVSLPRAAAVTTLLQLAVSLLPLRLGELAIFPLLRLAGVAGTLRGLSILVFLRFLDVASLLVLALVSAVALEVPAAAIAVALAVVLGAGTAGAVGGDQWLRVLVRRFRHRRGPRRRLLRQALQLRREWRLLGRSPWRLAGLAVCSLTAWFGLWGFTVALLRAMGFAWPVGTVLLGMLGASLGAGLPLNAFGNFGTLEGGWAAALGLVGIPAAEALATGFATHLYSLLFTLFFGVAGAALLAVTSARSSERDGPLPRNTAPTARREP